MAPNDQKVIVDQVSNLSAAKETVLLLGLLSSRLILLLKRELWIILFSAEAILASSTPKFGIEIPRIDDEVLNSSTESTISTSLIQCIASVGNCEKVHTSVEPYLPAGKGCWCREIVNVKIRNLQSLLVCPKILGRISSTEWLNLWLTVQTGISDLHFVLVFHFSPL